MMSGRRGRTPLPGGPCAVCRQPVDIREAMKVRPGQLPFGDPMHDLCYETDLIRLAVAA